MNKTEYTPKRKWRIECTEEKLRLMASMVEDITRFIGGQPQLMNCLTMFDNGNEIGEFMLANVRPMMNLGCDCDCVGWNGRNTTNKYVRREVAQGYAAYKSILAVLANEYDWNNVHSGTPLTCEEGGELMAVRPRRRNRTRSRRLLDSHRPRRQATHIPLQARAPSVGERMGMGTVSRWLVHRHEGNGSSYGIARTP